MTSPVNRILIADPHAILRRGVKALLEAHDTYHIYTLIDEAADAEEALRLTMETNPTIAIVAYSLPDLDGVELTRRIRSASPRTEVLMHTSSYNETKIVAALQAGARAIVLKADGASDLLEAVKAVSMRRPYFSKSVSRSLLERFHQPRARLSDGSLTGREKLVVQLIAEGCSNKQVSELIEISTKTVETHRSHVMKKLDLRTTADLVRFAIRNNIAEA